MNSYTAYFLSLPDIKPTDRWRSHLKMISLTGPRPDDDSTYRPVKYVMDILTYQTFLDRWCDACIAYKNMYPGNYSIEKLPTQYGEELRLVFDSPQDETWFLLKYS